MTWAAWLVWLLPLFCVPFVPLVALINEKASKWFTVIVSGLTAVIGVYQAWSFDHVSSESLREWVPLINVPFGVKIDGLSVLLSAFVSFLSFLIILYSVGYMEKEKGHTRFYFLILLFIGSMLGLVMAGNIIQLYFFWEIVGICSAFLIAFWNERESARKAGLKAFVVTRFGDAALLIAVLLMVTNLHTTNLDNIISAFAGKSVDGSLVFYIGLLTIIGAMGKSAQVPLHIWLPDAMEGPTPVSALIHAATMVNAGVYLLTRLFPLYSSSAILLNIVLGVGLASMILGAVCASAAEDLKKILAYSTISQLGLMFVAIGLGSWLGGIFHLISQGLFKALAFLAAGSVIQVIGTRNIEEMGGLRRTMKYSYLGFLFSILAMSGLPPLIGFWTKDEIIYSAISNTLVTAIILLVSLMTAFYSFRALFKVFYGNPRSGVPTHESSFTMILPIIILSVAVTVGELVLGHQNLLPFTEELSFVPTVLSVFVLIAGSGIAYIAFYARTQSTKMIFERYAFLSSTRISLLEGLGFDRFYNYLYRSLLLPAVKLVKYVQSGLLGVNALLMLSTMIILFILIAIGVI